MPASRSHRSARRARRGQAVASAPRRHAKAKAKAEAEERGGRGRPRDAERHAQILEAARELILEVGYARVTLDAIAKRAGVSRTTLYTWWGHRAPLVEEAIFDNYGDWPVPDCGSFVADLEALVEEIVREMSQPHVARAFPALSAEFQADPSIKAGLRERYGEPMAERWRVVFDRAVGRGELPKGTEAEAALQLTLGAVMTMTQSKIMSRKALRAYLASVLTGGLVHVRR